MADKHVYINDSPKNPDLKTSPFDWTYTTNLTGRFGKVNCAMMKYLPPHTKLKVKPYFGFDMQPLVFPVQTNVRCHLKFYKVPLRILWKDFEDFASQIGTNGLPTNGGGTQFVVPYIKRPTGWNDVGSLAEQIGCCNRTLQGYGSMRELPVQFTKGTVSDDFYFPVPNNSVFSNNSLFFELPISSILQAQNDSPFEGLSFKFSSLVSNYTLSNPRGFIIQAFVRGTQYLQGPSVGGHSEPAFERSRDGFRLLGFTTVTDYFVRLADFNSSTSNCSYFSNGSNVNVNGVTLASREVAVKITDSLFHSIVNDALQEDQTVFLRVIPTGSYVDLFFPDPVTIPTGDLVNAAYQGIDEVQQGDETKVVYSDKSFILTSSLGCTSTVKVGMLSVRGVVDTKFDSIEGADPAVPIPALPFRALEFIHNYFMRNPRIDPFIKDGVPTYNRFLTNDGSGADSTTPVESWNALYESDYFTTCVKEPQFGNAPLVGATVNDTSDTGILTFGDGTTFNNYVVKLNADVDGNVAPLSVYPDNADKPTMDRLNELINFGISINDLRNVSTFQRMLERMQRTSYRFANVVYEFFGTNPPVGDHYPQYLGGVTRNVTVDKITNIAESEGHPLGAFAGQGKFRGEGESISVFTTEPCYLVCIQYFTVTPTYSQYLPKHLLYKNPLDFYMNPEFAFMGPQPVYKGEIAPNQVSAEHFYDVFGYNRPYAELFGNVDEVHGLYKTDMANYLLQRFFGDAPQLNKSFIEINSADLTNIFAVVNNTDKMFGQILFKGTAQLPAPRSYLPRSI